MDEISTKEEFIIMGDINNLYQVNKENGRSVANVGISEIISSMRKTLEQALGNSEADIVIYKMGDELYTRVSTTKETLEQVMPSLNDVRASNCMLTVSVGYSKVTGPKAYDENGRVMSGPEHDLRTAEIDMDKQKSKMKKQLMEEATAGEPRKIVEFLLSKNLDKIRLDLNEQQTEAQEEICAELENILLSKFFEERALGGNQAREEEIPEDDSYARIEEYKVAFRAMNEEERVTALEQSESIINVLGVKEPGTATIAEFKYDLHENVYGNGEPNRDEDEHKYIVSRLLSEDRRGRVVHEYFLAMKNKDVRGFQEEHGIENMQMISYEAMIALKDMNESGYSEANRRVDENFEFFESTLEEMNIDTHGIGLVKKGPSSGYVFIDKISEEQWEMLESRFKNMRCCMAITDLEGLDLENMETMGKPLARNGQVTNKKEIAYKVNQLLEKYVERAFREICEDPYIQVEIEKNPKYVVQIKRDMFKAIQEVRNGPVVNDVQSQEPTNEITESLKGEGLFTETRADVVRDAQKTIKDTVRENENQEKDLIEENEVVNDDDEERG